MEHYHGYLKRESYLDLELTEEQAKFIKNLRVKKGYSWRAVHRDFQIRYEPKENWWKNPAIVEACIKYPTLSEGLGYDINLPHGHQIDGMDLCVNAMNFLGETFEDGWNE